MVPGDGDRPGEQLSTQGPQKACSAPREQTRVSCQAPDSAPRKCAGHQVGLAWPSGLGLETVEDSDESVLPQMPEGPMKPPFAFAPSLDSGPEDSIQSFWGPRRSQAAGERRIQKPLTGPLCAPGF